MGCEPNIIPFPGKGLMMTKARFQRALDRLREELLPYYEDDEESLDEAIVLAKTKDFGAVGLMSAIAWCHSQLGVYRFLNEPEETEEHQHQTN